MYGFPDILRLVATLLIGCSIGSLIATAQIGGSDLLRHGYRVPALAWCVFVLLMPSVLLVFAPVTLSTPAVLIGIYVGLFLTWEFSNRALHGSK